MIATPALTTTSDRTRGRLLIALATVGFITPNALLIAFVVRHGLDPATYFHQWVQLLPSAQLGADLAICSLAFFAWTAWDGPRTGVRIWWATIPAAALVGLCFALPLYLLMRERAIQRPWSWELPLHRRPSS